MSQYVLNQAIKYGLPIIIYGKTHSMIASGEPRTISAGHHPVYDISIGRLATMICLDAEFTDVARR